PWSRGLGDVYKLQATFRTTEAIDEVIRPPAEKAPPVAEPVTPPAPRKVQGCYSSPYRH
ncbi:hypothetical protein M8371_29005, partial [Klebsiella pneumoniae]|nr:hypothetical protein [Klebsiella pneumoniae]